MNYIGCTDNLPIAHTKKAPSNWTTDLTCSRGSWEIWAISSVGIGLLSFNGLNHHNAPSTQPHLRYQNTTKKAFPGRNRTEKLLWFHSDGKIPGKFHFPVYFRHATCLIRCNLRSLCCGRAGRGCWWKVFEKKWSQLKRALCQQRPSPGESGKTAVFLQVAIPGENSFIFGNLKEYVDQTDNL